MSALYVWLKLVHVVGACVLLGTGLGIAFFMWMAHRTRDPGTIASTARVVVIADAVFTAAAVLLQPLSGAALAQVMGYSLREPWIVASFALYLMVGACWLPVVWLQLRLRDIARGARHRHAAAGAIPPAVPHLVLARLARLRGRHRDLRADDRQAADVALPHKPNT
jgi:uncharacterized membrane protein